MKIRCAIIEDEPMARRMLEEYVSRVDSLELKLTASDGLTAFNALEEQNIQLVFLDIHLPGLTGLELADHIPPSTKIIFVTAYQEFAIQGYDKNAVDYLLKPVTFSRFLVAVQKTQQLLQLAQQPPFVTPKDFQFFAKSGKRIYQLDWNEVYYIEGLREYVALITEEEKVLVYKRMKDIEDLSLPHFARVHNSYFINLKKIKKIEDNSIYILKEQIPISSKYKDQFFQLLKTRLL